MVEDKTEIIARLRQIDNKKNRESEMLGPQTDIAFEYLEEWH